MKFKLRNTDRLDWELEFEADSYEHAEEIEDGIRSMIYKHINDCAAYVGDAYGCRGHIESTLTELELDECEEADRNETERRN